MTETGGRLRFLDCPTSFQLAWGLLRFCECKFCKVTELQSKWNRQTQVKQALKSQHTKQTGVPHADEEEPPIWHLVVASSQDRWRRSANAAWGERVSVGADGRSGQSSDPQRGILIGFVPPKSGACEQLRANGAEGHGMSESVMFSASQPSHGPFHTAIGQLMTACVCENPVPKLKIPCLTFQQETESKTTTPTLVGPVTPVSATRKDDGDRRGS